MNQELPDVQAGFRKGRGTRDQVSNICWIIEKAKEFQKNIYFCFIDYTKALTVWITTNWKILKKMGIPDHHTCLLRNLYEGQEAKVRTCHGTANCRKFFKRWEYQTASPASWEICMQFKRQQLEPDMKQWTCSQLGKEYTLLEMW